MTTREKLYRTVARLNRQLSQMTNDHAHTSLQHEVLAFLAEQASVTVHDIATYLGLSESSATQVISRLVRGKMVLRHRDTNDHRLVHIRLSQRGVRIHQAHVKQQTACLRDVFAGVSDRQLKQVISVQHHILQTLSHRK